MGYRGEDEKGPSLTMILHQFLSSTNRHNGCMGQKLVVIKPASSLSPFSSGL